MKIIIVGCGRVGATLAEKLNGDGNDVTVVDVSASKTREVATKCDVMGVVGNGATYVVQREAGIESADLFIAVTGSDELNLLCCVVAKREGNCATIARLKNPAYSEISPYLKEEFGLAMVINPEYEAAKEIARILRFPSALQIEPFAKGRVELIKFKLPNESKIANLSVREVAMKYRADVLICTVERGEEAYIANGDFVFCEKDVVSIVASPKNANDFFKKIEYKGNSIKNAIAVGGGAVTRYLCEILEKTGISLKIIEKDLKTCEELSVRWKKFDVIHGNGARKDLLLEEGIAQADAFVALSDQDEENILLSLFAKEAGKAKLITRINRTDYDDVIRRLDLDATICPRNIAADLIVRYARAKANASGSNVETMYNVIQGKVEASEFIVKENSPVAGVPLKQLKFKENVLVASIFRNGEVVIPHGDDLIQAGDAVVIVTKQLGLQDVRDVLR